MDVAADRRLAHEGDETVESLKMRGSGGRYAETVEVLPVVAEEALAQHAEEAVAHGGQRRLFLQLVELLLELGESGETLLVVAGVVHLPALDARLGVLQLAQLQLEIHNLLRDHRAVLRLLYRVTHCQSENCRE